MLILYNRNQTNRPYGEINLISSFFIGGKPQESRWHKFLEKIKDFFRAIFIRK